MDESYELNEFNENIKSLPLNTTRIFEIGKFTKSQDKEFKKSCDSINKINRNLTKKRLINSTKNQEFNFIEEMKSIRMKIIDIKEDGNCLYRSISHQVYGNEDYYRIVKKFCIEYLRLEREFFGQFIDGGIEKFEEYLELKNKDGKFF